jgi:DNA recombination protein RmuC
MFSIEIILILIVVGLVLYQLFRSNSKNSSDLNLDLNKYFSEFFEKVNDRNTKERDLLQSKITNSLTENREKIQGLESQIRSNFEKASLEQRNYFEKQGLSQIGEFEKLKNQNLESLTKIQNQLQERLQKSTLDLIELNKTQLGKLQENTNRSFELLSKTNQERLNQINQDVQKRLDENFARNLKSFQEVTQNLGKLESTAQKMIDSTKSVDKLNNIFARTSSKAFGDFGEKYLESLLRENLAEKSWSDQVQIPGSQDKIDFVIYLEDKKIGIDSKFPVTKFQDFLDAEKEVKAARLKEYLQAVLKMAQDISVKYLKTNYIDALFLYLPSDSMYNEVVNNQKMVESLQKLKVIISSPATIFPLILIINQYQLKLRVSENAERIIDGLKNVSKNISGFKEEFRKLGDKIRQAQTNYDQADRNLIGVEKNILMLQSDEKLEEGQGNELM